MENKQKIVNVNNCVSDTFQIEIKKSVITMQEKEL